MHAVELQAIGRSLGLQPVGCAGCAVGVSIDSRKVVPGALFVALQGTKTDGSRFVHDAFKRGAAACIVARGKVPPGVPRRRVFEVEDPLEALGRVGALVRRKLACRIVAVTGSVGKTTTKELIAALLSVRFRTAKAPASFNNNLGVPLTVCNTPAEAEILVAELGANAPGEIAHLCGILRPHDGVVVNVGPVHLEGFGTLQGVIEAKSELAGALPREGTLFLPVDLLGRRRFEEKARCEIRHFGPGSAVAGRIVKRCQGGVVLELEGLGRLRVPGCGKQHLGALLAACAVAIRFGLTREELQVGFERFSSAPLRWQVEEACGIRCILDCYNANPLSMHAALEELRDTEQPERVVVVLGDMYELGRESARYHRELGESLARFGFREILLVGEAVEETLKAYKRCGGSGEPRLCADQNALLCELERLVRSGDLVFFKASRAVALEEAARRFLKERRGRKRQAGPARGRKLEALEPT